MHYRPIPLFLAALVLATPLQAAVSLPTDNSASVPAEVEGPAKEAMEAFQAGRHAKGIELAKPLAEQGNTDALYLLGFAYNATGQYESAIHVLSTTGLPDSVINGLRASSDFDGFMTLVNALKAAGETELAQELAAWSREKGHTNPRDWWVTIQKACTSSILNLDEHALQMLEKVRESPRLAWDSTIRDSLCFKRYANEPIYQETLRQLDQRRAKLLQRLPATLAGFDVSL